MEIETKQSVGARVFGPNGLLAQKLDRYEARQPQMDMADLCERMLKEHGSSLIEAGTGTGKSFAYLVPAIESGKKVLVSTESIQLQEQLVNKDLPFLETALGQPIRYAIAKGRGNYFCERNAIALVQEHQGRLIDTSPQGELIHVANELLSDFAEEVWDGNRSTLKRPVNDFHWSDLAGDDSCTKESCPHAETCAYMKAKEKVENANVVITNHHFYALHHYAKERSGGIINLLPEHRIWIADEAHTLPDIVQSVFGVELRQGQPKRFVTKLLRQLKALRLELDIEWNVPEIEEAADAFFGCFRGAVKDEQLFEEFPEEVLAQAKERMLALVDALKPIRVGIHQLAARSSCEDEPVRRALRMLKMNVDGLIAALKEFFEPALTWCKDCEGTGAIDDDQTCASCTGTGKVVDPDPPVRFAEVNTRTRERDGKKHVTLHSKPAETRRIFKRIYDQLDTTVYCSATLAVGGSFSIIAEELGLNAFDVETLQAKSPFDYQTQVRGYFPRTVPDRKAPDYHDQLAEELLRIIEWTRGRVFFLFTANRDMREVATRIASRCDYPLLVQGEMSKDLLLEQFREEPSVLLGVRTFWTGVDIPGSALSAVFLIAFPFPQPEAPLVKARCQRIDASGRSSFKIYSLPRVIRDVQQGFGRLIRSRTDRGLFGILDARWHSTKYAQTIERSLPSFSKSEELPTDWSLDHGDHSPRRAPQEDKSAPPQPVSRELRAGVAGLDRGAAGRVASGFSQMGQSDQQPTEGLFGPASGGGVAAAGTSHRGVETGVELTVAGMDGGAMDGDADPIGATFGTAGCHQLRPGPATKAQLSGTASPRWAYLRAYIEAIRLDRGAGVGPVRAGVSDEERQEAQALWHALETQAQKVDERSAWLYENQDHPEFEALDARARKSEHRLAELRSELLEWSGADPGEFLELFAEVQELLVERRARAVAA